MAGTRVWLGFTHPPRANSANDLMPRSMILKLRCGAPMNWGTLQVLALSKIVVPNPNGMWSLKNKIGHFRSQHHHLVAFDSSSIVLTSSQLWPSEDQPRNALRAPWRLLVRGGRGWWMVSVAGTRVWIGFTHPPGANGADDSMPRSVVSKLRCGTTMN